MYALRKSDLKAFTCRSEDVCRIEEGSTNTYVRESRIIEDVLTEIEPHYNASVEKLRTETIDHRTVFAIGGFISYVQTCSPAGMRIFSEPLRKQLEAIAEVADANGALPIPPLLKFEWVRWWWGASGGRGQGRAKPGAANP
jgi:hypothetical protein